MAARAMRRCSRLVTTLNERAVLTAQKISSWISRVVQYFFSTLRQSSPWVRSLLACRRGKFVLLFFFSIQAVRRRQELAVMCR